MSDEKPGDNPHSEPAASEPAASAPAEAAAPVAATQPPEAPRPQDTDAKPPPPWRQAAFWIALIALALALAQWWDTRQRLDAMQVQVAERVSAGDTTAKESLTLSKHNLELVQSLQGKIGAFEAKLAESQSQQVALEAMYQELARGRDDSVIAEVGDAVNAAVQQLQLGGSTEAALTALQNAEARLARADAAQYLPLRRAVAHDIELLKSQPLVDLGGMGVKLDTVAAAVDALPLAFEARSVPEPRLSARDWGMSGFWADLLDEIWRDLKSLIRIQRLDRPDPALLAPQHSFFLRENLKLRLVNARLSLLQRDTAAFREDLRQAETWIARYFDAESAQAKQALATLRQLSGAELRLEPPSLRESVAAVHRFKSARDKPGTR